MFYTTNPLDFEKLRGLFSSGPPSREAQPKDTVIYHYAMVNLLAPVVETVDNGIHWINLYPVKNPVGSSNTYPLNSDLSSRKCYPTFEQPGTWGFTDVLYNIKGRFVASLQWRLIVSFMWTSL